MTHDLVDEAIIAHSLLEQALERAAVTSVCDEHHHAQRFISSYIVADSMEEFPAIALALKTGDAYVDDLRSERSRLGNITEEEHLRWFRYAMRHAYAGDAAGVHHAGRQALLHLERWNDSVSDSIRFIGSLHGNTEEEIQHKIRRAGEGIIDYLDATMYLLAHPICSQKYIGGLCDGIRRAFGTLDRSAMALSHVRELAYAFSEDGAPHRDFLRFSDRCLARINSPPPQER